MMKMPGTRTRKRRDRIDVHVTHFEKEAIRQLAARRGLTLSAFVRQCVGRVHKEEQERGELLRRAYPQADP